MCCLWFTTVLPQYPLVYHRTLWFTTVPFGLPPYPLVYHRTLWFTTVPFGLPPYPLVYHRTLSCDDKFPLFFSTSSLCNVEMVSESDRCCCLSSFISFSCWELACESLERSLCADAYLLITDFSLSSALLSCEK